MARLSPQYLVVGEILRPHGVRGEIRMRVLTDYPERLMGDIDVVYLGTDANKANAEPYTIDTARMHKEYLLIKFKEIKDRTAAEPLRGQMVMVDFDHAIPLEDGEYYLHQVIGLTVQTDDGLTLGTVRQIIETGANDVYVVRSTEYGELLLPAHDETIVNIDFDAEMITMSLPDGLLPDSSDSQ